MKSRPEMPLKKARLTFMLHKVCVSLHVEIDAVCNLACPASPVNYQHDPVQTTRTSVDGAIEMKGVARRLRARMPQASTSAVHGLSA